MGAGGLNICSKKEAIRAICQASIGYGQSSPYFFVVGAGVSVPSTPMAEEMIQDWRTAWLSSNSPPDDEPPATAKTIDRYEYWFQKAYLEPKGRQLYLKSKILGRPVPSASLRLASILKDGRISRLVLTTNFDLYLSRALGLLEEDPLVYDSADTANDRFSVRSSDLQILHVHGTYQYYDCANLRGEMENQAVRMVGIVENVVNNFSPLVIGYSGWEEDVIMTSLRRRLYVDGDEQHTDPKRPRARPNNVYWFCYREAILETLPAWLKKHPNVFFVLPEGTCGAMRARPASLKSIRESVAISQPADATLPADDVLQTMIDAVGIPGTELDLDPIRFFVRQLKIYIRGMEDSQVETVTAALRGLLKAEEQFQDVLKDLHLSHYADALQKALALYRSELDLGIATRRELMDAAWSATFHLAAGEEESPDLNDGFQLVVNLANDLRSRGFDQDPVRERLARARVYQGLLLLQSADYAGAITRFDEVIDAFGKETGALQDPCSSAMVNKGIALCRWRKPTTDEEAAGIQALYDTVIERLGKSTEPSLLESVASAMVNKGYLLNLVGRIQESLAAYDEVIARFAGAAEPSIQSHVTRAMINKAFRLGENHQRPYTEQAVALYEQITGRLAGVNGKSARTQLTLAWNGLAFQRLLLAKCYLPADPPRGRALLLQAKAAIGEALKLAGDSGMVIGNQAYIEFLLGDNKEFARQRLQEAIRTGGEDTRSGEIADSTIYPLAGDGEFASWAQAVDRAAESASSAGTAGSG